MTGSGELGDLYDLLGVRRDAPAAEITRAYHRRARALHPDAQPGLAGEAAGFRDLKEAYRVLHDPARRAAYDQATRRLAPPRPTGPELPAAGPLRPGWPAAWLAGATVWAGPVQVIPPGGLPAGQPPGAWLASGVPEWGWPW